MLPQDYSYDHACSVYGRVYRTCMANRFYEKIKHMRKIISMDLLIVQLITLQTLFHSTFCCAVRSFRI